MNNPSFWRKKSMEVITSVVSGMPNDAEPKAIRKAVSAAYPFTARQYHPYKVWLKCVRQVMGSRTNPKAVLLPGAKPVTDFMPSVRQWALDRKIAYELPDAPETEVEP